MFQPHPDNKQNNLCWGFFFFFRGFLQVLIASINQAVDSSEKHKRVGGGSSRGGFVWGCTHRLRFSEVERGCQSQKHASKWSIPEVRVTGCIRAESRQEKPLMERKEHKGKSTRISSSCVLWLTSPLFFFVSVSDAINVVLRWLCKNTATAIWHMQWIV